MIYTTGSWNVVYAMDAKTMRRIAGNGVEAPRHLAGFGVIGRNVTAHPVLSSSVANYDHPLRNPRRSGDGIGLCDIRCLGAPDDCPGALVERNEATVEKALIQLVVVELVSKTRTSVAPPKPGRETSGRTVPAVRRGTASDTTPRSICCTSEQATRLPGTARYGVVATISTPPASWPCMRVPVNWPGTSSPPQVITGL